MSDGTPKKRLRPLEFSSATSENALSSSRACNIASHARLEALVKQLELLRQLDTDAHDAVKAELQEQIDRLKAQVESLTALLESSTKALKSVATKSTPNPAARKTSTTTDSDAAAATASVDAWQRQVAHLKEQLQQCELAQRTMSDRYEAQIAEMHAEFEQKLFETAKNAVSRSDAVVSSKKLENDAPAMHDLRESLRQAERRERAAHAEVKRLSGEMRNVEILKEQLLAMEAKAARLEEAARQPMATSGRMSAVAELLERWRTVYDAVVGKDRAIKHKMTDILNKDSPIADFAAIVAQSGSEIDSVLQAVQAAQSRTVMLSDQVGEVQTQLSLALQARKRAESRVREVEGELQGARTAVIHSEVAISRSRQEAESFRLRLLHVQAIVDSYEKERQHFPTSAVVPAGVLAALQVRVQNQEKTIAESQRALDAAYELMRGMVTQSQLDAAKANINSLQAELSCAQQELNSLYALRRTAAVDSDKEVASAGIDTAAAAKLLAQGADPAAANVGGFKGGKVLHLTANPTSSALRERDEKLQAVISSLKEENALLRAQLAAAATAVQPLTAPKLVDSDNVPPQSAIDASAIGAALHTSNAVDISMAAAPTTSVEVDTLRRRMKDMFKQHITTFRQAVYRLTGYKFDLQVAAAHNSSSQVVIRNVYFEREEDYLQFQIGDDESIEMLETPFTSRLDPKLFAYLHTYKSIPAFLSGITLDLFDKQTLSSTLG